MSIGTFTEVAMAVALAAVLNLFHIPLPHLLYGGSVSLEALPILVVGLRRGARPGLAAGALYGLVDFLSKPVVVHPAQVALDYPLAFGALGLGSGLVGPLLPAGRCRPWSRRGRALLGILAGDGLRGSAHVVSGVVFFAAYAPSGQPAWLYSLVYNASYLGPQAVMHILLLPLLLRVITWREGRGHDERLPDSPHG
ncbi:MAG: energy-coupled thiamine transporter ThiT [Candidatus Latescibacterota bacterium]